METIELKLDEDNELAFSVIIEGTKGEPAKVRFVIEDSDMSIGFPGRVDEVGEVKVSVPSMKKMMNEGTYRGKLEVIAEERFFEPLTFNVDLKQALKVEASISAGRKPSSGISVIAKPKVIAKPVIVEKSEPVVVKPPVRKQQKTISGRPDISGLAKKYNISESEVRGFIKSLIGKK
jgi:hypothetical protein